MDIIKVTKALSDATRLEIFKILKEKGNSCDLDMENWACNCIFLKHFNMTQPTLTYHMKQLEEAQLVYSTKKGKYTLYAINYETVGEIISFFEDFNEN